MWAFNSKYLYLLILILLCSIKLNAQVNLKAPLDQHSLKKSIKKNNIKSLIIFIEMNKDEISERGSVSGKLVEIEFSSHGLISYRLRSDNRGNPPFIAYGKGSYFEDKTYDQKGRLIHHFMEDIQGTRQEVMTYNEQGNRVSWIHLGKNDTVVKIGFQWGKGHMVRSNLVYGSAGSPDWKQEFDEQGRVAETRINDVRLVYTYETIKDSLFTSVKTYKVTKFIYEEKYTTWTKYNRITSWNKVDASGAINSLMRVVYDRYGNATSYYLNQGNNSSRNGVVDLQINNEYDKRKLLVSRFYYVKKSQEETRILTKIEHFIYDENRLNYRLNKGGLDLSNN